MAQRSARARVKLDKISSGSAAPGESHARKGTAKPGAGGLMTPSASSVSGSSRNSLQYQSPKIRKSSLRRFFDSNSEKIRERLAVGGGTAKKDVGFGLGFGLPGGGLEEKVYVKRWEGGGRRGEVWDAGIKGKKVFYYVLITFCLLNNWGLS